MDSVEDIFRRYEGMRHRLPQAPCGLNTRDVKSLLDITESVDAFVFDAFGVLNIGETPIPSASERLDQLRAQGHAIRILSNAASDNHDRTVEKFRNLGLLVMPDEVITSRDAALRALKPVVYGCIAALRDDLLDIPTQTVRLLDDPADYDAVDGFLFLSSEGWTSDRQTLLLRALQERSRPVVIANADLVAPREYGFSLEPGHYGNLLVDRGIPNVRFLGKPFPEVYDMIQESLPGVPVDRIAMCGDTLHTDILGAAARGWRSVLVSRDGLFSGHDTAGFCQSAKIHPTWRVPRI